MYSARVGIILILLTVQSPLALAGTCATQLVLPGDIPAFIDSHGITVSGIPALVYPLEVIRKNLQLTDDVVAGLKTQRVLLVGDGFSPLLPFLLSNAVDAWSVDPIYHVEDSLTDHHDYLRYIEHHRDHLVAESASVYLKQTARASIKAIYSHMAISSILDSETRNTILTETARVLECGGSARFAWYGLKESELAYRVILTRAFNSDPGIHFKLSDNGISKLIRSLEASFELMDRRTALPHEWILPHDVRVQYLDLWRECP